MSLQALAAGSIVVVCLAHLGRSVWRGIRSRGRSACGGCASCEGTRPKEAVITLHRRPR